MKDKRYLFVINPTSGQGQAKKIMPIVESAAAKLGVACEYKYTSAPGDGEAIVRGAAGQGFTHVVGVGGDGTSHEIVNGLMGSDMVFGSVPAGSGNDFPRAAGIPHESAQAVETVFNGHVRSVDVGRLGGRYFINGLGIGLDGAVSHRFKRLRFLSGHVAYLWAAILESLTFKGFSAELVIDDWSCSEAVLLAGASNGFSQGGFKLAPEARVDDGRLDFHVIKDMPPLKRLIKIPKVLEGKYREIEEMELISAESMVITIEDKVPAHMDGQSFYLVPGSHKIEVLPKALKVMSVNNT